MSAEASHTFMASGNRVEELESRVRELEATISGLTDELVETRERLQAIEEEVEPEMDIIEGKPSRTEAQDIVGGSGTDAETEADGGAEGNKPEEAEADTEDDADSSSDDIIVA
jgi:uncharacterized coiled-coil protein SlyX